MNPALKVMVGGAHYQPTNEIIQPVQFYHANPQLNFQQTNIIKYAYRHKDKKGVEDLLKVIHYTLLEVGFQYPDSYDDFVEKVANLIGKS